MNNPTISTAGATPALNPDLSEAQRFLDLLDPKAKTWTFQTFDDNADRKTKALARKYHGTLEQHAASLIDMQSRGAGVFVTVNETDGKGRLKENITRARAAWVDLDGSPLEPVTAWETPHIIVDSSPGRFHSYWRIEGLELEQFTPMQEALIEAFKADESVHDINRVMRLPGFYHQKVEAKKGLTGTPYMVRMRDTGAFPAPFTAAEFLAKVEAIKPKLSDRAAPFKVDLGTPLFANDGPTMDEVAEALTYINADLAYHEWAGVLMAIHDEFGDRGLSLADEWSATGTKYRPGEVAEKFKSFTPGGGTSIKTVFALAKQGGANPGDLTRKHRAKTKSPSKMLAEALNLVTDKTGLPYWNTANAVEILSAHPAWRGVFGFNEFTRRRVVLKQIPGSKTGANRNLEDDDATAVLSWFNRNGFPRATATVAVAAVHAVARRHSFDPLKDYLTGLSWDGTPRISGWLTRYCGAEASDYTQEAGRRWLISAVARAFKPGCKADHMLVLEGEQGARKSSALAALAGEDWFSDALPPMNTKDASSYLRGRWIVEVAELEAMRREMDAVKAFISRQTESYRPAYGREEVDEPRRCIFAGTTNKDAWLRDETGGRRFWPVKVGEIDLVGIKRDRGQIWAEAVAAYKAGERWWLDGDVEAEARKEQASRMADDPWLEVVADAVTGRSEITIREILFSHMSMAAGDMKREHSDRVAAILKRQGWQRNGRMTAGALKGQVIFSAPS